MRSPCWYLLSGCVFLSGVVAGQGIYPVAAKKVIEFSQRWYAPSYVRDNLKQMETLPFDGVIVSLPDGAGRGEVFDVKKWRSVSAQERVKATAELSTMPRSEVLNSNFLIIFGASTMDWFNDDDWKTVTEQVRFLAKGAKQAGLKGLCWDAEPYHDRNPWKVAGQPDLAGRNYAAIYDKVRQRGREFMEAIQDEFPEAVVLSLRQLSDFQDGSTFSQHLLAFHDAKKQQDELKTAWWSLHPAFTNGLLDVMKPGIRWVDGNEDAYFYTSPLDFYRSVAIVKQDAQVLVAPENRGRFGAQYEMGQTISIDFTGAQFGILAKHGFPVEVAKQAYYLTPQQRARWFEHNTYYALQTTQEYVWAYTERPGDWWERKEIPAGFEEAIRSAKRKYAAGQPLGFSVEDMLLEARKKARQDAPK